MEPGHHRGERADQVGGRGERGGQTDCRAAAAGHRPDQHGEGTEVDAEQRAHIVTKQTGTACRLMVAIFSSTIRRRDRGSVATRPRVPSSSCPTRQDPP